MRRILLIALASLVALFVATGCGQKQDAYAFCNDGHGGVNEQTWEDDGDVLCNDYTEYEGDGDLTHAGFFLHHKKGTKPHPNRALLSRLHAKAKVVQAQRKAAEAARRKSSGSSSSGGSSSSRRSSGGGRRR